MTGSFSGSGAGSVGASDAGGDDAPADVMSADVMSAKGLTIRPALPEDWPDIWPILQDIFAAGQTYSYTADLTEEQAQEIWMLQSPWHTWVAELDVAVGSQIVGTCIWGPNRPGRGSHVATASFMVDPAFAGRGVARAMAQAMISEATRASYRAIQFNAVVETNTAAVHLWQKLGFRIIGTVPEAFCDADRNFVGLHIMHRFLP